MILTLKDRYDKDEFDLPLFKTLLVDTWQYFIDTLDDFGINTSHLPLIGAMYALLNRSNFPRGVLKWEYEAYTKILEGLLNTMQHPLYCGYHGDFYDGYIKVEEYVHCEHELHISNFDSYFEELAKEYYENSYVENYDENGKER